MTLLEYVQRYCKHNKMTIAQFAVNNGMSENMFYRKKHTEKTLKKVADATNAGLDILQFIIDDIITPQVYVDINGRSYSSLNKLCEANGISYNTFLSYIHNGSHSIREACQFYIDKKDLYPYNLVKKMNVSIPYEIEDTEGITSFMTEKMKTLTEKEREVLLLRYEHKNTQSQIAEIKGVTCQAVSALEKKALFKLEKLITPKQKHTLTHHTEYPFNLLKKIYPFVSKKDKNIEVKIEALLEKTYHLNEDEKYYIYLRYVQEKQLGHIAEILKTNRRTLYQREKKILESLKDELNDLFSEYK